MNMPSSMPRLKGFRFPREIIVYAVWAYHRFALSTADVEDLLAERGVTVSREAIRLWVNRFGRHFADCIKRDRPAAADKWHLDEVVIPINGVKHWLWRAVDSDGDVLDVLVQPRRNAKAARRFMKRLMARFGDPRVVITDKLRSYFKPIRNLAPNADHRAHKGLKNRVEGPHRPTRKREKLMGRFKSPPPPLSHVSQRLPPDQIRRLRSLARIRGWAPQGKRLTMDAPFCSWGTQTLL